jgi:diaminopimelate epimerase
MSQEPPLAFVKMSGTGNDFVVVDNRGGAVAEDAKASLARAVCPRRLAVGADGLILLEPSGTCDVRMRIFNADGSEAEMCGNGSRCLAWLAHSLGAAGPEMSIETMAGPVRAEVDGNSVVVELTPPGEIVSKGELEFAGSRGEVLFTDTGVPHAVLFVDDLEGADVRALGRAIRFHEVFRPAGANANFVRVAAPGRIDVRTYERGVEDETLACGTGATAAALVSAWRESWESPVSVSVRSGETLTIHFEGTGPHFDTARLEGAVSVAYRGELERGG